MPKRTVLLVDPNDDRRKAFREALEAAGYLVQEAVTPDHALWRISSGRPDLIVAEYPLHTARHDPFIQVARQLFSQSGDQIPILALTPGTTSFEHQRAQLAGADEQCTSDARPRALVAMVRKMIGASRE